MTTLTLYYYGAHDDRLEREVEEIMQRAHRQGSGYSFADRRRDIEWVLPNRRLARARRAQLLAACKRRGVRAETHLTTTEREATT